MRLRKTILGALPILALGLATTLASAQVFRVQCPTTTTLHPDALSAAIPYTGPHTFSRVIHQTSGDLSLDYVDNGGSVKCQQISGGDGFATMADGTQMYLFAFGPLSGLRRIRDGLPGTGPPSEFNQTGDLDTLGDPLYTEFNGAVGLVCDPEGPPCLPESGPFTGHIDPRAAMQVGTMNGNMPAPTMAIDEDDEFFLTLTNVGQIMRPDLFEQHTVHFHGYPNASAFYDGVPDASVAVNIGGSFTYYYLAPDAGTYFWHCHITPPEHLQMGMVGQIYVRPRQNRVPDSMHLYDALLAQQQDPRTRCYDNHCSTAATQFCMADGDCPSGELCVHGEDILCSAPLPRGGSVGGGPMGGFIDGVATKLYAYNDGDGSTQYDVEYPIQIHGFDPNFHFVGMTFNPEGFTDMKDKYYLLNGRSYPDTVAGSVDESGQPVSGPMHTQAADGVEHASQPLPTLINIPLGGRALLRISDLDTTEFQTLASLGIPMRVIALNARLLRDLDGNDLTYLTNSITVGGGESLDVILDATNTNDYPAGTTFALYTPNLDHLSNDAENFGGLMTEVRILNCDVAGFDPLTKKCR